MFARVKCVKKANKFFPHDCIPRPVLVVSSAFKYNKNISVL